MGRVERVKGMPALDYGDQSFLVLDNETGNHYVVSGVDAEYTGWEVLVFSATPQGRITCWGEVAGGRGLSFDKALEDLERVLNRKGNDLEED